jgi:hypothetical protein
MARLNQAERHAMRRLVEQAPLPQLLPPRLTLKQYLHAISTMPPTLCPPKPVDFKGSRWRL